MAWGRRTDEGRGRKCPWPPPAPHKRPASPPQPGTRAMNCYSSQSPPLPPAVLSFTHPMSVLHLQCFNSLHVCPRSHLSNDHPSLPERVFKLFSALVILVLFTVMESGQERRNAPLKNTLPLRAPCPTFTHIPAPGTDSRALSHSNIHTPNCARLPISISIIDLLTGGVHLQQQILTSCRIKLSNLVN